MDEEEQDADGRPVRSQEARLAAAPTDRRGHSGPALVQATETLDRLIKLVPKYQSYVSFVDTDVVALTDW